MFRFFNGIVFTLAIVGGALLAGVLLGALPSGADSKPPRLERWAASRSLHATIARETLGLSDPLTPTPENLVAAVKTYGANCAVCHGAADGKESKLAKGLYIKAPQLATDGVEDDPESVTFWKLKHGIRFTAMPAFGATMSDTDLWQLAMFLRRMDKLPPEVDGAWKALPSVGDPAHHGAPGESRGG